VPASSEGEDGVDGGGEFGGDGDGDGGGEFGGDGGSDDGGDCEEQQLRSRYPQ
jgi:hypothetical protein